VELENKIPAWAMGKLGAIPSNTEIKTTLDKAPGPDGLTGRFILCNWGWIGSDIVQEIQNCVPDQESPTTMDVVPHCADIEKHGAENTA
jgi:hypothetical protein